MEGGGKGKLRAGEEEGWPGQTKPEKIP